MSQESASSTRQQPLLSLLHEQTREHHAALNKFVSARIPLCVPPIASSPFAYAAGMTVFGHTYQAFESAWDTLLKESETREINAGQKQALELLKNHDLFRASRLQHDMSNLRRRFGPAASDKLDVLETQSVQFRELILESVYVKPHLALAYAYALYLGLFNGGRWISKLLTNAGTQFWQEDDLDVIADQYLSFWYFDDSPRDIHHGKFVKNQFRETFGVVADLLSDVEKADIVEECIRLFEMCINMVEFLDQRVSVMQEGEQLATRFATPASSALSKLSFTKIRQTMTYLMEYAAAPTMFRKDFDQHS